MSGKKCREKYQIYGKRIQDIFENPGTFLFPVHHLFLLLFQQVCLDRQFVYFFLQFPLLLAEILPKLPVAFQKAQFTSEGQIVESVLSVATTLLY